MAHDDDELNDTWEIGQRIRVTCRNSKHFGRYGIITDVYRWRLGIRFEDGRPGKFVDKIRAVIVGNMPQPQEATMQTENMEDNVGELTRLLEHMAFTAATLISSNADDPAHVSRSLRMFQESVRDNTRMLQRTRRNNSAQLN
jgi:hypothetical protein